VKQLKESADTGRLNCTKCSVVRHVGVLVKMPGVSRARQPADVAVSGCALGSRLSERSRMLPVLLWCYRSAVLIVTGSVHARPDSIDQVLALSIAHVRRSRQEPGCLAHAVHRDCEDALRLVFVEHWADADALRAHFRVPASGAFVQEVSALAARPPEISVYEARALSV
jgi:quinol monooxygenase YgiN